MAEKVMGSSQNRVELGKVLPLRVPLAVHIFPSYYCDFKCCYCIHSLSEDEFSKLAIKKQRMNMATFKNAMDGLGSFEGKLRLLNFAGHGEPLLNPDIVKMVAYAKARDVSERIEIVTNAHTLTEEMSNALISAGLDSIRISIQGLSSKKYKEISNVNIDFEKLLKQIKYFYEHKQNCKLYIKIIGAALENMEEEQRFYNIFENICDQMAVEHMVPTAKGVDYAKLGEEYNKTQQGYVYKKIVACPMPFYMMIVEPDGEVRPCCATSFPVSLGNVNKASLSSIWQSEPVKCFWKMHLEGGRKLHAACKTCTNPDYGAQPGDIIDNHRDNILKRLDAI